MKNTNMTSTAWYVLMHNYILYMCTYNTIYFTRWLVRTTLLVQFCTKYIFVINTLYIRMFCVPFSITFYIFLHYFGVFCTHVYWSSFMDRSLWWFILWVNLIQLKTLVSKFNKICIQSTLRFPKHHYFT